MRRLWTSIASVACLGLMACGASGEQAVKDAWSQQFLLWINQLEQSTQESRHQEDLLYLLNEGLFHADLGMFAVNDLGAFKVELDRSMQDGEIDRGEAQRLRGMYNAELARVSAGTELPDGPNPATFRLPTVP